MGKKWNGLERHKIWLAVYVYRQGYLSYKYKKKAAWSHAPNIEPDHAFLPFYRSVFPSSTCDVEITRNRKAVYGHEAVSYFTDII